MHLGNEGQVFNYLALNSEVENHLVNSKNPYQLRVAMGQDPTTGQPVYSGLPLATSTAAPALINSVNTPAPAVVGSNMAWTGIASSHSMLVPSGNHTLNGSGMAYTG